MEKRFNNSSKVLLEFLKEENKINLKEIPLNEIMEKILIPQL